MFDFKFKKVGDDATTSVETALRGINLLSNPFLNKGTAFAQEERWKLGLEGLLPEKIETLDEQVGRVYAQLNAYKATLEKTRFLYAIYSHNRILFYNLLKLHVSEIVPLIYTPHIADLIQNANYEWQTPSGLYLSYNNRKHWPVIFAKFEQQVDLIVVTDGERILGLGDQGVNGVYISIAKAILYTVFGGIKPWRILPVVLDVGTNNLQLLNDPLYRGLKQKRIKNTQYLDFIDYFISIAKTYCPTAVLQWEDFAKEHAAMLLQRFQGELCSFNDDIQGTAVVTLAALLAAMHATKRSLTEQNIVILGAGSAGVGIADLICAFLEEQGISATEARKKIWLVDKAGLLMANSRDVSNGQQQYLRSDTDIANWQLNNFNCISLLDVINNVKPQILVGCCGGGGKFTKDEILTMAKHVERPVILPLSNPNAKSEANPQDLIDWTEGKALIATGSPFQDVIYNAGKISIAQCNNALVFPGIGLGAIISQAREISVGMLLAACKGILTYTQDNFACDILLPEMQYGETVAIAVALSVAKKAQQEGIAHNVREISKSELSNFTWQAEYF